ncbi:carbon-nitrogen hydrolase family protein [Radiobacillus sp. PE A8.2]|uniref:carbon-nitrogen hydrolase family protein n=1 Tax=Radiobacillus sp. PE A8.2 TaxID=3380349 RepID=UPI00388DB35C
MVRNAKVCALSPYPLEVEEHDTSAQIVSKMKNHWTKYLELVMTDQPDLVVLPEMCDRPVIADKERRELYYEERGDQILELFAEAAKKNKCYIAYSAFKKMPDGTKRNCTQLLDRQGELAGIYFKNFPTVGEINAGIVSGTEPVVVTCDFGTVGITICWDLTFEELRLAYAKLNPDIIIHSSLGQFGLRHNYWALTCRSYYVGAIARKEAQILSPLGDLIETSTNYTPFVTKTINLDCKMIQRFTVKEHFDRMLEIKKKYGDKVKMRYPSSGELGTFLLSSETDEFTVEEIISELNVRTFDNLIEENIRIRNQQLLELTNFT